MRASLIVNTYRPDAVEAARKTSEWLRSHGYAVGSDRDASELVGAEALPPDELGDVDLIVSFGGDGSLMRAAHVASRFGTPILGVYFGRFGFVTQVRPEELGAALSQFADGTANFTERIMVQSELLREDRCVAALHSLNEAVVQRAATAKMLTFDVSVNGRRLARYPADGVMVATPTGSTGYSLSAGGPILDPSMDALLLTAVMPHTLSARPLVLRGDALIEIRVETLGDAVLSCDGQSRLHLLSGDWVRITRSPRRIRLVSVDESDFLDKLSERLQWSQGRGGEEG